MRTSRFARHALMTTASTAALVLATGGQSEAQTASWWASIEGEYQWINGDALNYYGASVEPEEGISGKLHFGGPLGGGWSGALGLRIGKADKESASYGYQGEYASGDVEYKENHLVADLEIGREVGIGGGGTARVFGGLRFARFDGDGSYNSYFGYSADTTHRFTGIGPRVGADVHIPVANNVRADLGIAGAALYGKRKLKFSGSYFGEYSYNYSDSDHVIVPNVEASVALTYLLGQHTSLSAGVRAERYFNMMPTIDNFSIGKDDRFSIGPFVRLTIIGN